MQLLDSPNEVILSSVPPGIVITGSLEILKDPEIGICDTVASNHLNFLKYDCLFERPNKTQSQGISGPDRRAELKIDIPSIVCDFFGNELTRVTVKDVSYRGDSNFNLFSVGKCLINGWKLSRDADHVMLSRNGVEMRFDIVI